MHSPERILEALAWLYGVEFRNGEAPQYWAADSSVHVWFRESDGKWLLDQDHWDEDITAEVEHALAVTAPWEWRPTSQEQLTHAYVGKKRIGHIQECAGYGFAFCVGGDGSDVYQQGYAQYVSAAKTAARTAYLTWMRGRLALRRLEK